MHLNMNIPHRDCSRIWPMVILFVVDLLLEDVRQITNTWQGAPFFQAVFLISVVGSAHRRSRKGPFTAYFPFRDSGSKSHSRYSYWNQSPEMGSI